ncbi:DNA-binding response regulator [Sphingomonas cavernae]|uniref:DNA-binding response regulator n=1 Tax=Sphingomonas cavernae TaxID=2320861 RepID=A0A418WSS7_9SPHN|nr:DNA-binding response regulator [Sphingomonas cavernae]
MRVLIVDDEPLAIDRLREFFRDIAEVEVIGDASDGKSAAEAIAALKPDLVMLDIQMPERSGMAVAADLPAEGRPEIIFVTAFEHYAPDAFEVDAVDYLLKPVRFDRLRQAITRARRRRALKEAAERSNMAESAPSPYHDAIWVQVRNGSVRVPVDMIDWIEAAKDYVLLHTETRSYLHRSSMSALEAILDPAKLVRVHRSSFVRPARVDGIERLGKGLIALKLSDGAVVAVGPNYTKDVINRLRPGV